ncbi:hypothetical protein H0X06_05695 [Candidatus Dependentiae bacterium]|nr:hypothetical protein [Candidatus Dependentiae bacterium]
MLKKYVVGGFLCIASIVGIMHAEASIESQLLVAIKNIDEKKVQLLLMDTVILEKESKERLLDAAEELISQREKATSLFRSWRDLLALGVGLEFVWRGIESLKSAGGLAVILSLSSEEREKIFKDQGQPVPSKETLGEWVGSNLYNMIVFGGVGIYFAKKGANRTAALNFLDKAKRIQGLIDKTPAS